MDTAKINKQTFLLILDEKQVSKDYLISAIKTSTNPCDFVQKLSEKDSDFFPTIRQAKEVAKLLRVPFASLYMMPEKIKPFLHKIPPINNRLMQDSSMADDSLINLAISDVVYSYDFYLETMKLLDMETMDYNINYDVISNNKFEVANMIREDFGFSLDEQYKIKSPRQLYLYIKNKIEEKGIFIQEFTNVEVTLIRAFAIYDENFKMPIIGINSNDRPPAKSFSLIHELVHILKKNSSLCNEMNNRYQQNQEEIFCNAVAGEVLTPTIAIEMIIKNNQYDLTSLIDIQKIADKFSVSKEVISRRLLDLGKITTSEYDTLTSLISQQLQQQKEQEKAKRQAGIKQIIPKKPDREAFDKSSISLSRTILTGYLEDVFSKNDIANILAIKSKWVDGYLQEVAKWNN